jgi:crotonobetainyl-CoA:carnitine CoA-transferase CaiB-like acyl-CoA transferase
VVELGSGISAAYAARLLADFGADVIKVEPPDRGDETRRAGPFPGELPHPEKSGLFLYLNGNKRSVTLDITSRTGATLLRQLLDDADVLIENLGPRVLESLPFGAALPARLVVCSISSYGQDGPKAAYLASEISAYAAGGMMYITGDGNREPLKHGLNQAAHLAGVNAASASLAAAMLARRTGCGQAIDISLQEVVAQTIFPALNLYSHTGGLMKRAPTDLNRLISSSPMPASDGYIMPSYAGFGEWESFAAFLETPALTEERFMTPAGRQAHGDEIDALVAPKFATRSKHDLFHGGQEWRLTFTAVQTAEDLANCPHLAARGFFVKQHHPVAGTVRMPGMAPFASAVARSPLSPAPLLGEHTRTVLECLGVRPAELPALRGTGVISMNAAGTTSQDALPLPLAGVRILELGMVFVLPLALTPLAALGADVIKVEAAARPDQVRWGPPPDNLPREDGYNHGANFQMLNRNKRGITIDLTRPGGRELLLQLVAVCDVVAENFTPRVLRNLGLRTTLWPR